MVLEITKAQEIIVCILRRIVTRMALLAGNFAGIFW